MINAERIGATLKDLRGDRSQQSIADLLGVSAVSVSKWERGESMPTDDLKIAIAQLYGRTVQDIFFAAD